MTKFLHRGCSPVDIPQNECVDLNFIYIYLASCLVCVNEVDRNVVHNTSGITGMCAAQYVNVLPTLLAAVSLVVFNHELFKLAQ